MSRIENLNIEYKVSLRLKISKLGVTAIDHGYQKHVFGSHSQYLEDIFLDGIFSGRKHGCYIDIGANDPDELNNTKRFYENGWSGINIEPNSILYERFIEKRPDDINLNVGIGDITSELKFYEMDPHTLSTFKKSEIPESIKKHSAHLVAEKIVPVITLSEVFKWHVKGRHVDFISIDTEGFEYQVLAGNDWDKYRPAILVMEVDHDHKKGLTNLLDSLNYQLVFHNGLNGFYADRKQFP